MHLQKQTDSQKPASFAELFPHAKIDTKEFATAIRLKQQSIRAAFCRDGHYLGLIPTKLPNGRMLWDAADVARLINGG